VLTTQANVFHSLARARAPASLCMIAEWTADNRQLVFTGFDPVKGRGHELARFDTNPTPDADMSGTFLRLALASLFSNNRKDPSTFSTWSASHRMKWL
jgi:hypothetical protein